VAYKLDLPATSKIHDVVHVSLLKKAVRPSTPVSKHLPPSIDLLQAVQGPQQVLDRRLVKRGNTTHSQVLVQWEGLPPHLATWEDKDDIQRRYDMPTAWGHAVSQGGENVTTQVPCQEMQSGVKRGRARDIRRRRISGRRDPAGEELAS
jgi:hypothetical protein